MSEPQDQRIVASKETVLLPGNPLCRVAVPRALPNITILIHGVNDLGEAFDAQEQGICEGLNERLNRKSSLTECGGDLVPNRYNTSYPQLVAEAEGNAAELKKLEYNPDAVLYHRIKSDTTHSPVIPFYWGFREDGEIDPDTDQPMYINTTAKHGEWTDRFGTRIDKDGAKGGGPFPNATSCLPEMFGPGFKETIIKGDPTHPLLPGPGRRYMVLAAKRLAMLIKIIRAFNDPAIDATEKVAINIIAHSQGCMVSLLAHAFLAEEGFTKVADCLIMNDPPYSLEETFLDWATQTRNTQQTTQARLQTLINITGFITDNKRSDPPLASLENCGTGTAGEFWKSGPGAQKWRAAENKLYTFEERDNRGKVYLYFCAKDATVALRNIQGIGWKGVPDTVTARSAGNRADQMEDNSYGGSSETLDAFTVLKGKRFFQRVFSSRVRKDVPLAVGMPPQVLVMKASGEPSELPRVADGKWAGGLSTSDFSKKETRFVNGEELFPPCVPVLTTGEDSEHPGKLPVGEIDARIALTFKGIGKKDYEQELPNGNYDFNAANEMARLQKEWDAAHPDPLDSATILEVTSKRKKLLITRTETSREARERWTTKEYTDNSYHSAILTNPMHSAMVHSYDLALGKPIQNHLKGLLKYWCLVADWRTDWDKFYANAELYADEMPFAGKEPDDAKKMIKETQIYYKTGKLPAIAANCNIPPLIKSQTLAQRGKLTW